MNLKLVDYDKYLPKLRRYFNCYLRGRINYHHIHPETKQLLFESEIHFYNLDVDNSIYYFKNNGFFYFGLGREISDFVRLNANTKLSTHLNYNIKVKDAIHLAKNESGNIFLLMSINYELLSDREICSLKEKNEVIEINKTMYINFGELTRGIDILKNIRNFMNNIRVDTNCTSFLKLVNVNILHKFSKDSRFCNSCDNLISESYKNNEIIKNLVGDNPNICADCYSKKLMNYFLSKATDIFLNRHYLEILAENSNDIKFYLNLFDKYNMFDKNGFLQKNSAKKSFIPPKFKLNPLFIETMQSYSDLINKKTIIYSGDKLSDFESLLLKNNLSYADGVEIKNNLEDYVLSGKIKSMKGKTHKNIDKKLKELINIKSSYKKKEIDIFEIIKILNKLTLDSNGKLNENFIDYVTSFGLDKHVCWKIREELIEGIENKNVEKDQLQAIFNKTSNKIIQEELSKIFTKKECYCINDSLYLKTILNQKEMINFIKNLNSIYDALEINIFNLFNLNNNFFKIILDFKVIKPDVLNNFLKKFGFDKLIYWDNGDD